MKKKLLDVVGNSGGPDQIGEADDEDEGEGEGVKEMLWRETKKLWVVAGPAIFARFATFGVHIITQAFIGHIGPIQLAAYALVGTVLLRFANSIQVTFNMNSCFTSIQCCLLPFFSSYSRYRSYTYSCSTIAGLDPIPFICGSS